MTKFDQRRPLMGNSLMAVWLMLVVNSLDSRLTAAAVATMSTAAAAAPTRNTASMSLKRPTSTAICSSLNSENPVAVMVIAYAPGCRLVKRKRPSLSVVAVSDLLVSMLRSVTVAFATAALFGSVAVPPTAPVTADWASARASYAGHRKGEKDGQVCQTNRVDFEHMSASHVKNEEQSVPTKDFGRAQIPPRAPRIRVKFIRIGSSLLEALAGERVFLIVRLLSRSAWRGAQLIAITP